MKRTARLLTILFVLVACVGCDQAAKSVARETLAYRPGVSLLGGVVHFGYAENPGAFLSLGADWPAATRTVLLGGLVAVIVAVTLAYLLLARDLSRTQVLALSLIAAGGIGNLIDRVFRDGLVIDFVRIGVGPLHTGVFNVADVAIVAGVLLFALSAAMPTPQPPPSGQS